MQKHKMFIEAVIDLRRDLRSGADFAASAIPVNGMSFLTAYKTYELFANNLTGFWEVLKTVQGNEDSLHSFVDSINAEIAKRDGNLTSRSSPPPARLPSPHWSEASGDL
jgi:hypothetical protein